MTKIAEIKREAATTLNSVEVAQYLLEDYFNWTSIELMMEGQRELTLKEEKELREMIGRLENGEPLQYVTGRAFFRGEYYRVTDAVLIPRPETSELVDWVLEEKMERGKVLDIGTGSGIIACSIKEGRAEWEVVGVDVSERALAVARENGDERGVRFVLDDILNLKNDRILDDVDIVVSNPPYVLERERVEMERHVLDYEPHLALFVPNDDALRFYKKIAELLKDSVERVGKRRVLFFEINEAFGEETMEMMRGLGYIDVECRKDAFGKDRMVRGVIF
ncbi:MAG: peptide chain release factor N(5)-glutamine methyltransferase [Bacteroidia bacterium]|nr:peptide chain release factor N(5)-glutamine methyltransferase [Bacteroidia bacterium]